MADVPLEASLSSEAQVESRLGRAVGFATQIVGESGAATGPRLPGRLIIDESKFGVSPMAAEPEDKT